MTLNKTKVDKILTNKHKDLQWLAYNAEISENYVRMLLSGERTNPSPKVRTRLIEVLGDKDIFEEAI
jgi:hypothetical protein